MEAPEIWKAVVGFEGRYEVSNLGRVYSRVSCRFLDKEPGNKHYPAVTLSPGRKKRRIHALVLEAFIGPRPEGCVARHKNMPISDVRLANLEYGTVKENMHDKKRHGTFHLGEKTNHAKLTAEQVHAIKSDFRIQQHIADDYGVSQGAISRIKSGKVWSHV